LPLYIGGNPVPSALESLRGAIAEMVFVSGSLSSADLARLERYLNAKYALWQ
jgi:hypothetical protein